MVYLCTFSYSDFIFVLDLWSPMENMRPIFIRGMDYRDQRSKVLITPSLWAKTFCLLSMLPVLFCTFIDSIIFSLVQTFLAVEWIAAGNSRISLLSTFIGIQSIVESSCIAKKKRVCVH